MPIATWWLGHLERVRRAQEAEVALPGLFLCASYRGGVSVSDCITSAYASAAAVADHVRRFSTDSGP